jgi:hypothetical protein
VPDPPAMVRQLASYLRPGGILYVSAPFFMLLPWYPTHLLSNRKYSGSVELYQQAGFELVGGRLNWYPAIYRKTDGKPTESKGLKPLAMRLTGRVQAIGRWTAWPFLPVHWVRWAFNRKFQAR